jgi:ketopantoate reductase
MYDNVFDNLAINLHEVAVEKGFWPEPDAVDDIFIAKQCMMIVSEVTEVMEAIRKDKGEEEITKEFLAIAALEDVNITMAEALAANDSIANTMVTQVSSTAQDLARGKKTEIDFLNGYIVELGRRYGIATPYNESVHALVKMVESKVT